MDQFQGRSNRSHEASGVEGMNMTDIGNDNVTVSSQRFDSTATTLPGVAAPTYASYGQSDLMNNSLPPPNPSLPIDMAKLTDEDSVVPSAHSQPLQQNDLIEPSMHPYFNVPLYTLTGDTVTNPSYNNNNAVTYPNEMTDALVALVNQSSEVEQSSGLVSLYPQLEQEGGNFMFGVNPGIISFDAAYGENGTIKGNGSGSNGRTSMDSSISRRSDFEKSSPEDITPNSAWSKSESQDASDKRYKTSRKSRSFSGSHSGGDHSSQSNRRKSSGHDIPSAASGSTQGVPFETSFSDSGHGSKKSVIGEEEKEESQKPTQVTDKSCVRCRVRKVRCDRYWPKCLRCKKRREDCEYGDSINLSIEPLVPLPEDTRIVDLEAKLQSLETQLSVSKAASMGSSYNPPEGYSKTHSLSSPHGSGSEHFLDSHSVLNRGLPLGKVTLVDVPAEVHDSMVFGVSQEEQSVISAYLVQNAMTKTDLGFWSVDWRLALPAMAEALTIHLLDTALRSCCFKIASFQLFKDRMGYFKNNLSNLDPPSKVAVFTLCAVGARASPHSALFGVSNEGVLSLSLAIAAGRRRESVCQQLERRALECCYRLNVLDQPSKAKLEALACVTQFLIFQDIVPRRSRFYLRNYLGMFIELQQEGIPEQERVQFRKSIGTPLYVADAIAASQCCLVSLISTNELQDFFDPVGTRIPDFQNESLAGDLDKILSQDSSKGITIEHLDQCIAVTSLWISGCQRAFAAVCTAQKQGAPAKVLPEIQRIWSYIDRIHSSVQRLQEVIVNIDYSPKGAENDPFALDSYVLLGIRMDTRLVDLVHCIHLYLMALEIKDKDRDETLSCQRESDMRVRKCLKLTAFYFQLCLNSQDKHVTYHLTLQQELLPQWSSIAVQTEANGLSSPEFVLTDEELDSLCSGLQVACFYTPIAVPRLQALNEERQKIRHWNRLSN